MALEIHTHLPRGRALLSALDKSLRHWLPGILWPCSGTTDPEHTFLASLTLLAFVNGGAGKLVDHTAEVPEVVSKLLSPPSCCRT